MLPDYAVIDAHVHVMPWDQLLPPIAAELGVGRPEVERLRALTSDPARLIDYMDERNIARMVLINYVSPEVVGFTEAVNEFSAKFASYRPERFIPFGGIDPRRVRDVPAEMDRLLGSSGLGLRGIKLHPPHQYFRANAYATDPALRGLASVYEKCVEHSAPVMFHTGTSVFPGARNKYGDPMDLDDLIVDFPELKIILAHGGRPLWMDTALFLLRRSPNVILDISSVPPRSLLKYFPWLERVADQTIFGSDWPGPIVDDIRRNVEDFYGLPLSEETKRKILFDNANRLFA